MKNLTDEQLRFLVEKNLKINSAKNSHNIKQEKENDPLNRLYHSLNDGDLIGGLMSAVAAIESDIAVNEKEYFIIDKSIERLIPKAQLDKILKKDLVALSKDWVDLMSLCNNNLKKKIDKIKNFVEARKKEFELEIVHSDVVKTILTEIKEEMPDANLIIEDNIKKFAVYSSHDVLKFALSELILNGLRFSTDKKVNVFYKYEKDHFSLMVKNNKDKNFSIPQEIQLFRRSNNYSMNNDPGLNLGVGLDTVNKVFSKIGAAMSINQMLDFSAEKPSPVVVVEIKFQYAYMNSIEDVLNIQQDAA